MEAVGQHYIAEGSGCNPETIGSVEKVEQILVRAAVVARVQVWSISFHRFNPNGVSGVVVISESHLSVHTWPELGYVALDIFTCGPDAKPEAAVEYALKAFGATNVHITEVTRGLEEGDRLFYHSIVTWEETLAGTLNGGTRQTVVQDGADARPAAARDGAKPRQKAPARDGTKPRQKAAARDGAKPRQRTVGGSARRRRRTIRTRG